MSLGEGKEGEEVNVACAHMHTRAISPSASSTPHHPASFDRARNKEVGVKHIQLSTFEEAFTSEHWIVRIYKV